MLNDAQVLAALSNWLSPGEIARTLERNLRVPEAWQRLHDRAFLNRVREAQLPSPFSPAQLGLLSLDRLDSETTVMGPLSEELVARQESVWHRALHAVPPDPDLGDVQLLAMALVDKASEQHGPERLASFVLSAPRTWRSPLACAWMVLPASTKTLEGLIRAEQPQGIMLAANSLLANLSVEEAAKLWLTARSRPSARTFLMLQEIGEPGLASTLAALCTQSPASPSENTREDRLEDLLTQAACKHIKDEIQSAHDILERAWSTAVSSTSVVAEQLAELARAEHDPVLEVEARRKALSAEPTPRRRAWLAMALLEMGRTKEALSILPEDLQCTEESIAAGLIRLKLGYRAQAVQYLHSAAQASACMEQHDGRWMAWLADGLKVIGEIGQALTIARNRLDAAPCDLEARIALTHLLAEAGDLTASAQEAHLTLALAPTSQGARRSLAIRLQESGQSTAALAHWQTLSQANPAYLTDLITCALEAGDVDLAKQSAQAALHAQPEDAPAKVLYARALVAGGDVASAQTQLEEALQKKPHLAEAWLALADSHAQVNDDLKVGTTLENAVQAAPECGSLHMAFSRWLQSNGRLSEALEAAEEGTRLEPYRADWLIRRVELLTALERGQEALELLQDAYHQHPAHWPIRRKLAEAYEGRGEIRRAWSILGHIPEDQDAHTYLAVGRIAVQAAQDGDLTALEPGLAYLVRASAGGSDDPNLQYWLGMAYLLSRHTSEALQTFQACLDHASLGSDLHRRATIGLARSQILEGDTEQAITTLETAIDQYPDAHELQIELSEAFLSAGDASKSLGLARKALEIDPSSEISIRQLARAAEATEEWDLALQAGRDLTHKKPDDIMAWLELARMAIRAGEEAQARNSIAHAVALGRRDARVLQQSADMLVDLGAMRSAKRMLQHAVAAQPNDASLLRKLAALAEQTEDWHAAQTSWMTITELEPENSDPLYRAGRILWDRKRSKEAIDLWQRALDLDPGNAEIHASLGRALTVSGDCERGLNHLASARQIRPKDVQLALEAGTAAHRAGRREEAAETLQQAIHLEPERLDTVEAYAKCLLDLDRSEEAHETLKQACVQSSAPPSVHALRAVAALQTGDIQASEEALVDASSLTPKSAQDVGALAQAALRLGHWDEAMKSTKSWIEESGETQALLMHARVCLRIYDAHWLYAVACEAEAHAPGKACLASSTPEDLEALLSEGQDVETASSDLELLRLRARIAAPGSQAENLAALESHLSLNVDPETAEGLAIAYLRARRPEQALEVLQAHIGEDSQTGWAGLLTGFALTQTGRHDHALRILERASGNVVLKPLALFLMARSMQAQGKENEAIEKLNAATAAWPEEAAWHFTLAALYAGQADLDAALPHYQQAAELRPDESAYALGFARTLRNLGQTTTAVSAFARVLEANPEDGRVWREAGETALAVDDFDRAQAWCERAATISPSDAASLMGSARALQALGRTREAGERAQAALRIAPQDPNVLLGLGEILSSQGKYQKAMRTYDQALSVSDDPVAVHLRRSEIMIKLNRSPQAVEQMIEIVRQEPGDDRIWNALTSALEQVGDLESALETATRAVRLAPRSAVYRTALGRVSRKSGHLDRAIEELTQAESIAPSEVQIPTELGHAYIERRELTRALEAYQRAIALDPQAAPAHFGAAMAFKELKNYQQASDELQRALELDPNDPEAHQQLAAVRALALVHGGILQPVE
jgi:tetratricopeptide (TPR) repeat protein